MFIIKRKFLLIYLNYLKIIIEKKSDKKILLNFLFVKKKNKLYLIYKNEYLQINIKIKFINKNQKDFKILILFDKFFKIIKNLPNTEIKFFLKFCELIIKCDKTKFKIILEEYKNYSKFEFTKINKKFIITKKKLENIINYNYFINNKIENLNDKCLFFIIKRCKLITISTDNYRLSYYEFELNDNNYINKFIINFKTLLLLKNLLKINFENIEIKKDINMIKFKIKNIIIISKLIIKKFPYIKKFYKKNYKNKFIIERNKLKEILERSISFNKNELNCYNKWILKKNSLKIITNFNKEKLIDKIKVNYNENFKIYLNTIYLLDFIKNVKSKLYEFKYIKNKKLIIVNIENENYKYISSTLKV